MKRWISLAVLLALLLGGAQASVAVRMDGAAALLSEDGAEIVAAGTYADIVSLGDGLFAASPDGALYALMDGRGEALGPALYDELQLRGGMLLAHRDGGWGLLSEDGAELGSFDWDEILPDGAAGAWALRSEEEQLAVFRLDASGRERDSGLRATDAGEPGEGLLPLRMQSGLWGYCDAAGYMAIPARFEWAGSFTSGRAAAVEGGRYGAIDANGAWVLEPDYDFLEISGEGFLLTAGADGAQLWAADGSPLAAYPGEGTWAALAGAGYVVGDGESLRVYDASGAMLEALAPDASVSEGIGAQLVISEGMWGEDCVRLSGTQNGYQNLYPLGTAGGEAIYACMEARAARYENELLNEIQLSVDMDSARYGLVDGSGELLLPPAYLSIEYLADDRFLARSEDRWQMIDASGAVYWRSERVTRTQAPSF